MVNSFYTASGIPVTGSPGASAGPRGEFALIQAGFDKMPTLTASTAIIVNAGGTALGNTVGTLALAGNFATTGAFSTTFVQGASVTITLPVVSGTLSTLAGSEELTNKTLNASVGKGTWTSSGTWTLPAVTLGGAITYGGVTLSNAVTGTGNMVLSTAPTISQPNLVGTTTNNNAAAGSVGEYLETIVLVGAALGLTNGIVANICSVSLTAGDWDVFGVVTFTGNAATVCTRYLAGISQTSATAPTHGLTSRTDHFLPGGTTPFSSTDLDATGGPLRISLAGTTTVYLIALAAFTVNTCSGYGQIIARRIR